MDVPALRLRGCGSYAPGHDVHMIPALRAANGHSDPATGAVPPTLGAVVVDCFENGVVVLDVDGVEQRWWNHDIVRLAGAARAGWRCGTRRRPVGHPAHPSRRRGQLVLQHRER